MTIAAVLLVIAIALLWVGMVGLIWALLYAQAEKQPTRSR